MFKTFFIIWALFFFGIIGTTIWIIVYMFRKRASMTPEKVKAELSKVLEKKRPELVEHRNHDIQHLCRQQLNNFYVKGISSERERGVLADENGKPFLFYAWADTAIIESKFQLFAVTHRNTYYVRLHEGFMVFKVNDEIVAFHQYRTGIFLDKNRQLIGQINRNVGKALEFDSKYNHAGFDIHRPNDSSNFPIEFVSGTKAVLINKHNPNYRLASKFITPKPSKIECDILMALSIQYVSDVLWSD